MCGDSISVDDFAKIADALSDVVARMRSLEEISTWLKSQKCVKAVQLDEFSYLVPIAP